MATSTIKQQGVTLFNDISNATEFSFVLNPIDNKYRHGLAIANWDLNNANRHSIYLITVMNNDRIMVNPIAVGSQGRTLTAAISGNVVTLTYNGTVYGGVRLLWMA